MWYLYVLYLCIELTIVWNISNLFLLKYLIAKLMSYCMLKLICWCLLCKWGYWIHLKTFPFLPPLNSTAPLCLFLCWLYVLALNWRFLLCKNVYWTLEIFFLSSLLRIQCICLPLLCACLINIFVSSKNTFFCLFI